MEEQYTESQVSPEQTTLSPLPITHLRYSRFEMSSDYLRHFRIHLNRCILFIKEYEQSIFKNSGLIGRDIRTCGIGLNTFFASEKNFTIFSYETAKYFTVSPLTHRPPASSPPCNMVMKIHHKTFPDLCLCYGSMFNLMGCILKHNEFVSNWPNKSYLHKRNLCTTKVVRRVSKINRASLRVFPAKVKLIGINRNTSHMQHW